MTKPAHTPKQVECDVTDCEKCATGKYQTIKLCPMHKAASRLLEALKLIESGYRLAEKSTPANLRRCILDARQTIAKAEGGA